MFDDRELPAFPATTLNLGKRRKKIFWKYFFGKKIEMSKVVNALKI